MFNIKKENSGTIIFKGRLDASQIDTAREIMDTVTESCTCDFEGLDYISSMGLGLLLEVQKRLSHSDHKLTLAKLNRHIKNLFEIAGFNTIFDII
jgi:anti-sigma B factor antagonist